MVSLLLAALTVPLPLAVARRRRRGGQFTPIWDEFTIIEGTESLKYKSVTCDHCDAVLEEVQPSRELIRHVRRCVVMPAYLKERYERLDAAREKKKKRRQSNPEHEEPRGVDEVGSTSLAPTDTPERSEDFKFRCQMAIANFFFKTAVAFRVVEHDALRQMFAFVCPELIMPDRHQLAGELLHATYEAEREEVIKVLKKQSYVSFVSDGWSNPRRESLINFIVTAPDIRPLLWTCRVTGADTKTGAYMVEMFREVIEDIEAEIGRGKVVSITTDNASAMKSAWEILEMDRRGFLATGCAAHTLSLLMKDVLGDPTMQNTLTETKELANFIRSHTATNAEFKTIQQDDPTGRQRGLKLPVATRWYSSFECIKLVMENEKPIRKLFGDDGLLEKYASEKDLPLKALVDRETFWAKGAVALQLLEPIHRCIGHFEKDTLSLSVIYQQFLELRDHPVYSDSNPGVEPGLQTFFKKPDRISMELYSQACYGNFIPAGSHEAY